MAGPKPRVANKNNPYSQVKVGGASFTVGAEVSNAITVNIQLKDGDGVDLAVRGHVGRWYLSDDANGDTIATAITSVAAGTDGVVKSSTTGQEGWATSEADGDLDMVFTLSSGAKTVYLVLIMPDGTLVISTAITFAA